MEKYVAGLVSVIVPVYNRADMVGKCIESILEQTYHNIEVIVINDGSTDNSLQIMTAYSERNPGKIVVIDQQNSGQAHARNIGMENSKGEFIAFLDSDDTWEKDKLLLQIPLFRGDVGLVYCGIREVNTAGACLKTVLCDPDMRGNIYRQLLVQNRMTGGSVVISRTALESVGGFDESFNAAENWDLWIRIAEKFRVEFVNQPLLNYLCHSGNMSVDIERMMSAARAVLQKYLPHSSEGGPLKQTYCEAYANHHYIRAVYAFSRGEYRQAREMFLECWKYRLFYRDSAVRFLRTLLGKTANGVLKKIRTSCLAEDSSCSSN